MEGKKKVIIVDDEQIIRRGIRTFIPWEKIGCKLIGEASNGIEALSLMEKTTADIVITDIRMPMMDGLELTEELYSKYPHCKVIILTGYSDFEYARKALRFHVTDYLLKPVGEEGLVDVLRKTVLQLNKEDRANRKVTESLNELRQSILRELIAGEIIAKELKARIAGVGFNLDEIRLSEDDKYQVIITFPVELFKGSMNIEIPKNAISLNYVLDGTGSIIVALSIDDKREVDCFFKQLHDVKACALIGNVFCGIDGIRESFKQALEVYKWYYGVRSAGLLHYNSLEKLRNKFIRTLPHPMDMVIAKSRLVEIMDSLYHSLETTGESEVEKLPASLLHDAIIKGNTKADFIEDCARLYHFAISLAEERGILISNMEASLFLKLKEIISWQKILEQIKDAFLQWKLQVGKHIKNHYSPLTLKTIDYIKSHFKSDIYLRDIAKLFKTSESHLSRVFKHDTGMNFTSWVNRYRVEYSKELLASIELKLYDIADLSGFSDYKYYTRQFKRYVGISPLNFRKNLFS